MAEENGVSKVSKRTRRRARNLAIDLATFFVIAVVAVLILVLFGQQGVTYTGEGSSIKISGLVCRRPNDTHTYFDYGKILRGEDSVRANFQNDDLMDLMYSFEAFYGSGVDLSAARTHAHANFDLDYGNLYVHRNSTWSESFSADDKANSLKFSVYSQAGGVRSGVSHVFGLGNSQEFPRTLDGLKSVYEAQGYSCEVNKND